MRSIACLIKIGEWERQAHINDEINTFLYLLLLIKCSVKLKDMYEQPKVDAGLD